MKKSLLQLIVCPLCVGTLACESFTEAEGGEVESGVINCACGAGYPVIGGIPRLLPPALQSMLWGMHPEFYSENRGRLPSQLLPGEGNEASQQRDDRALKA